MIGAACWPLSWLLLIEKDSGVALVTLRMPWSPPVIVLLVTLRPATSDALTPVPALPAKLMSMSVSETGPVPDSDTPPLAPPEALE